MEDISSYILSAYSFIFDNSPDKYLNAGYKSKNGNPLPSFDENLLIDLCSKVEQIFAKENNVLELEGDFIIVGDIHGSLHDLLRILNFTQTHKSKVLFLGDYVDRGHFSLECITILFALKVSYPDMFYLIRGNHEFDSICSQYGFKNEILNYSQRHKFIDPLQKTYTKSIRKSSSVNFLSNPITLEEINYEENNPLYTDSNCYKYTEALYNAFLKAFAYLPIAAILNKTTFCIHGGLSPNLRQVDDIIKTIKRPIERIEDNLLLSDVMWSDPSHCKSHPFEENPRGRGYLYNGESISYFLKTNSLRRIIRAHQCVKTGILHHFIDKCITIFSASSYDYPMGNHSSIIQLFQNDDTMHSHTFCPLIRLEKSEAHYYKVQSLYSNENQSRACFSLLHPKLVSNIHYRMHPSGNIRQMHKSTNNFYFHANHHVTPFIKPKFITNQRKTLHCIHSHESFLFEESNNDKIEDKSTQLTQKNT